MLMSPPVHFYEHILPTAYHPTLSERSDPINALNTAATKADTCGDKYQQMAQ